MRFLYSTKGYDKEELRINGITLTEDLTLIKALLKQPGIMLDTETNMTETYFDKKLLLLQIGTLDKKDQFVFDMTGLTPEVKAALRIILESNIKKYIHNALFEYTVIKNNLGIDIDKIRDTYIMSRLLVLGINTPKGYHSYKGLCSRLLQIEVDKTEQTTFHEGILTVSQLNYAFDDVISIYDIYLILNEDIIESRLQNSLNLKNAVVRCYGDLISNEGGLILDTKQWLDRNLLVRKDLNDALEDLNDMLLSDELKEGCEALGYISTKEEYIFKWSSSKVKLELFNLLWKDLTTTNKVALKKFIANSEDPNIWILEAYMERDFETVENYFITNHKEYLIKAGMFKPKGVTVNWGSPAQVLNVFRLVYPELKGTGKEAIAKLTHPLIKTFKKYIKVSKAYTSYGKKFITKNMDADGKVRPHKVDFFLNTGRTAIGALMTIPANNAFRNCFYPEEGNILVGADFSSLELCIIAAMSGCKRWMDTLMAGKDLHSSNCGLMFGDEWIEHEGQPDEHGYWGKAVSVWGKQKRQFSKTLSFGLAYGMGARTLADRCDISLAEAKELIKRFFTAFPEIKEFLDASGKAGVRNLYSETPKPFYSKRFYDEPADPRDEATIERAAKNQPIQGAGANIMELALVYLKKALEKLPYKTNIKLVIHDEAWIECPKKYGNEVQGILEKCMASAGNIVFDMGIIKAEGEQSLKWKK